MSSFYLSLFCFSLPLGCRIFGIWQRYVFFFLTRKWSGIKWVLVEGKAKVDLTSFSRFCPFLFPTNQILQCNTFSPRIYQAIMMASNTIFQMVIHVGLIPTTILPIAFSFSMVFSKVSSLMKRNITKHWSTPPCLPIQDRRMSPLLVVVKEQPCGKFSSTRPCST